MLQYQQGGEIKVHVQNPLLFSYALISVGLNKLDNFVGLLHKLFRRWMESF